MRKSTVLLVCCWAALVFSSPAAAQFDLEAEPERPVYEVFDAELGSSELIDGQEVVVIREPAPRTAIEQAPPLEAPQAFVERSLPPHESAIWVEGHWGHEATQLVWVEGHYVDPQPGFVFVAPRWVFSAGYYYFFPGYYRPCSAYVQSYFNPYYYYQPYPYAYYVSPPRYYPYQRQPGLGYQRVRIDRGPYWPLGTPAPARASARSALPQRSTRPVGHPASVSRGGAWPSVGSPSFGAGRPR